MHRPALVGLWILLSLLSVSAYAQTYELNVGDSRTLYAPDPPMGTLDNAEWSCSNSNVWIFEKGSRSESAEIKVANYFSGTATITCSVKYSWYDSSASTGNRYKTGYTSKTYYISTKPTEVKLSKTSLELELGDEVELSYTTNPSGLEPEVEWRTTDKSVATLSSENQYYRQTISNEKKIYVSSEAVGTCVVKLECNTGYPVPTCSITVKDDRPHLSADVASGSVKKGTKVTLTCDKTGADIRYTTDGTEPSKSSTRYSSPIEINEDMTIKAKAYLGSQESKTSTFKYTIVSHLQGEILKAKTIEGVELSYVVKTFSSGVCLEVSSGNTYTPAIDKNYSGKITIPYRVDDIIVRYIGERAFYDCNITNVVFEENFELSSKTIRKEAFRNCKNLKSVSFPHGISLETMAFYNCSALENIVFEGYASYNFGSTTDMFNNCNSLKQIYLKWGSVMKEIKDNCFSEQAYNNAILYVPENLMSSYSSTSGWKKFKNRVAIGSEPNKKLTLTAEPLGGEVTKGTTVILTAKAEGNVVSNCDIYYTLNGNTPTKSSTKYNSYGITINSACTLKAIAYKEGYQTSDVLTLTYTIKETSKPKLTLSASPNGGQVSSGTKVTLTAKADGSTVSNCDIYYTLNGNTPSKSSTKYTSSGITINSGCTLKAIAYKSGYEDSEVGEWKYTIKNDKIDPTGIDVYPSSKTIKVGDTFTASYTLTPSNATTTVTWYSDNSSIASVSSSGIVTGKSAGSTYINAKTANGKEDWCKVTVEPTSKPKLVLSASPSGGQVSSGTNVTLTTKANGSIVYGCEIYYTLNGNKPSKSSTKYTSSGITMNERCTLKAIAYKDGYETSEVITMYYSIEGYANYIYCIGSTDGWNRAEQRLKGSDGHYSGFLYCAGQNNEFKFQTEAGNWDTEINTSHFSGSIYGDLSDGGSGSNIRATAGDGVYYVEADLAKGTLRGTFVHTMGVIGDFNDWSDDVVMSWNADDYCYEVTGAGVTANGWKFRVNRDWSINLGGTIDNLDYGGDNIEVVGNTIKLYPTRRTSDNIYCIVEGNIDSIVKNYYIVGGPLDWATSAETKELKFTQTGNYTYRITIPLDYENDMWFAFGDDEALDAIINDNDWSKLYGPTVQYTPQGEFARHCDMSQENNFCVPSGFESFTMDINMQEMTYMIMSNTKLMLYASPDGGSVLSGVNVVLGTNVETPYFYKRIYDTDIYYTLNGSAPSKYSTKYTGNGITIDRACTLRVIAYKDGFETSDELTAKYTVSQQQSEEDYYFLGDLNDWNTNDKSYSFTKLNDGKTWQLSLSASPGNFKIFPSASYEDSDNFWDYGYCAPFNGCQNLSGTMKRGNFTGDDGGAWYINQDDIVSCVIRIVPSTMHYEIWVNGQSGSLNKDSEITLSSSGYATFFSSGSAYMLPNGLSAQVVTNAAGNKLAYKTFADNVVPKGVAVIIESSTKQAGTFTLTATENTATYTGTNLLRGSDEATTTTGEGYHYKLSYGPTGTKLDDVFGWYWGEQNGAPFQIEGHKAWLVVPRNVTRAAGFTIEGESQDVETIDHSPLTTDCYYDLQGRPITDIQNVRPGKKGVYIRNGQKVVVK